VPKRFLHAAVALFATVGMAVTGFIGTASAAGGSSSSMPAYARALKPKIQALVKNGSIPGAFVLIRSPKLGNWSQSFGSVAIANSKSLGTDNRFRIGSATKSMVGTVLLQLVQQGKISLSDPVSKYISGVPNGNQITIAQLMDMRSGLYNYTATPQFAQTLDQSPERALTPNDLLSWAFANPPDFAPGQDFKYSNTNTILEGLIIQKLTGQPLGTVLKNRIFKPLGMKSTYLPPNTSFTIASPHPEGYMFGTIPDKFATGGVLSPQQQAAAKAGALKPNDATDWNPSWAWAAGSVISTPSDLARFVKALVGGGLLNSTMQKQRLASLQPADVPGSYDHYGYNILSWGPFIGHSGDIPGFVTGMYYVPKSQLTVVVEGTLNQTPWGASPREEIMRLIYQQLLPGGPPLSSSM
jgi:D-alanyl-D-alanine carboxypeptidase